MKRSHTYRKGQKFGRWTLLYYLGGGGNGEVWASRSPNNETKALKLLKNIKQKAYNRFIDEVSIIEQNVDVKGIIPIHEKFLPKQLADQTPFYVMPLAEPSESKLKGLPAEVKSLYGLSFYEVESGSTIIVNKINAVIQVAETLNELHKRKIYHRDIKPANILYYEGRFSLADFGLVSYPNKREISLKNEEIGPKWTMAPEMRRDSSKAIAAKADIYSLAKTLWIYLTENRKGFDGQYSTESIIHLKKFYPQSYTSPLDNLLISCTDNDPTKRPTINKFISTLKEWKKLNEDFHERNQTQWFEIQTKLFPTSIPSRVIWEDINDIVKVLKLVCSYKDLNHVFLPTGGGLDLIDVRLSHEVDCIELDLQLIDIVKPNRLLFESFGYYHEWNYFRLEAKELEPSGVYKSAAGTPHFHKINDKEELTQLYPGRYEDYNYLEERSYRDDDGNYYEDAKTVTRWFRGSFVIFCKRSAYNLDRSTYDGRHNKMTTEEFREYIQRSVNAFKSTDEKRPLFEKYFGNQSTVQKQDMDDYIDSMSFDDYE
ncbi:MAG: protein kinase [Imperialibacter sp.]